MSYTWPGMIKLNKLQAIYMFRHNKTIYKLYEDDTETEVFSESEIWNDINDVYGMEIEDNLFSIICEWLVKVGTEKTMSGSWIVFFKEVAEEFGVDEEFVRAYARDIADYLDSNYKEILSETWLDDGGFDMNFGLAYCPNVEGDGCV